MFYRKELKRLLLGRDNILYLGVIILVSFFIFSHTREVQLSFIDELSRPETYLTHQQIQQLVDGFSWQSYLLDYFYSDKIPLLACLFLTCFGIKLADGFVKHWDSGWGNQLRARLTAKRYIGHQLLTQASYILLFNLVSFSLVLVFIFCLFGAPNEGVPLITASSIVKSFLGIPLNNTGMYLVYYYSNVVWFSSYLIFLVWIASFVGYLCKNKVMAKLFPLGCYFITFLIGSSIGNVSNFFADLTNCFIGDQYIWGLSLLSDSFFPYALVQIIVLLGSLVILYRVVSQRMENEYV